VVAVGSSLVNEGRGYVACGDSVGMARHSSHLIELTDEERIELEAIAAG
jgi:hypothetical protein